MRELWHFLQSRPSAISFSIHFWLRFLLLSAALFVTCSCALELLKKKGSGVFWTKKEKLMSSAGRLASKASLLILGMILGYASRDLMQFNRLVPRAGVTVISRSQVDPAMYLLADDHMSFALKFCADHIPNFDPGVKLKLLVYEDRGTCQSIAGKTLGYLVERDAQEQPIITASGGY